MAVPTALRFVEAQALAYRRVWRASVFSNFLNPVLYLLAMGASLGTLVDANADPSGFGVPYLVWLGPGLLAAQAMTTGIGEGAFPVMAGLKWRKTYHLVLQTPLAAADVLSSILLWIGIRVLQVSATYAFILVLFGVTDAVGALTGALIATLTGIAYAAPMVAFTIGLQDETGLTNVFRFGVVPMFLFSGTFFPITQLPSLVQPIAWLIPLWHGVELNRAAMISAPTTFPWVVSIAYLVVVAAVGAWWATRRFERRLVL